MNNHNLVIFDFDELYKIFIEIKKHINFNFEKIDKHQLSDLNSKSNCLIFTKKTIAGLENQIVYDRFPVSIFKSADIDDDSFPGSDKIDYETLKSSVLDDVQSDEFDTTDYSFAFPSEDKLNFNLAKENFEKAFIENALKAHKGKINQTAIKAHIPKKTLLRKIEKYEINPKEYYE